MHLLAPSIILTEFIKIAGFRIGKDAARTRLRLLRDRGMRTVALEEEEVIIAGGLLLSHQHVPTADALIASFVKTWVADYVVTDDQHYKTPGRKDEVVLKSRVSSVARCMRSPGFRVQVCQERAWYLVRTNSCQRRSEELGLTQPLGSWILR